MLFDSKWITYRTGEYKSATDPYGNPSPYFRRAFLLKGGVKEATLFASALGVFKIFLNGVAVSNDYLSPGWVNFSKKLPFLRYDVTNILKEKKLLLLIMKQDMRLLVLD